jgi:hypothetical protein
LTDNDPAITLERVYHLVGGSGLIAWDSFFHLKMDDQRAMFPRFAAHSRPDAPLLSASGPSQGESIGSYCGEPLYHAGLDASEYETLLADNGYSVVAHLAEDPACGGHSVWLSRSVFGSPTFALLWMATPHV